jgi:hypothetical protein
VERDGRRKMNRRCLDRSLDAQRSYGAFDHAPVSKLRIVVHGCTPPHFPSPKSMTKKMKINTGKCEKKVD